MSTAARLKRIEEAMATKTSKARRGCYDRIFHVVIAQGDGDAGHDLARSHGWTGAEDELLILRTIVSAPSQEPYCKPPYIHGAIPEARP